MPSSNLAELSKYFNFSVVNRYSNSNSNLNFFRPGKTLGLVARHFPTQISLVADKDFRYLFFELIKFFEAIE